VSSWIAPRVAATRTLAVAGLRRVRDDWLRIVEATVAASVAWLIAARLLHHSQPFFAPAAALIVLGVTRGQRMQRALEIVVGVAVGVMVADLITHALGPRTVAAVAVVTVLTLTTAVLLGGGPILAVQATVSAVFVAVVGPTGTTFGVGRFQDALAGGLVALLVNQLPLHRSPVRVVAGEAAEVFDTLSSVLDDTAGALQDHELDRAQTALERARATDAAVAAFRAAVDVGLESSRLDPLRRQRPTLMRYEEAARQVDYAVRNTRVLARAVVAVTRGPNRAPAGLSDAIRDLAEAVRALSAGLTGDPDAEEANLRAVRETALAAVRRASGVLTPATPIPFVGIVWQIRSTTVDLLRGTGMDLVAVLDATDEALDPPSR
jgi:uncharacterized membrane protein YgaE (UPF0421/DUF939 family)